MPNNEIWVYTSTTREKKVRLIDVFDSEVNYLRKFYLKTDLSRYQIKFYTDRVYASVETEDGYPRIKRFRLRKL